MDYLSATRGGGQGGYKNIVLAPASVQECHDLIQLAFHLADKYRNPVILLSDAVIGLTMEWLEVHQLNFEPLPEKDWAIRGKGKQKDKRRQFVGCIRGLLPWPPYLNFLSLLEALNKKYEQMGNEVRYETGEIEDAQLILVSYGYTSGVCRRATELARAQGLKVGWIRPITLYPFPYNPIREKAGEGCQFLVVEDSLGQMIEDVRLAVEGRAPIHFLGALSRHLPTEMGLIFPERVLQEIRRLL
jgi:2-oxoglutarate ferredoxin oxidoreductase subunit alpha